MSSRQGSSGGRHTAGGAASPWRRLAAIAIVAVVAGGLFSLRGGSEPDFSGAEIPADALAAGVPDGAAAVVKPSKAPFETIEVFASKDPFDALVADNSDATGSGGLVVKLVRVTGKDTADVSIDGTVYDAKVGEVFSHNFELMSAEGECAAVLYGDDQFTLCEGEQIVK